eukprot:TRINITY_DN91392_c0_g1_i1.p1 TRINITY_DN91392_c0_g1~~TRINITY_DN91392_c0_g1_i1.p1  ORF type:complete len:118 (-),score=13.72 TRINITY_DN91392_c0_g1_i1:91-411(-)
MVLITWNALTLCNVAFLLAISLHGCGPTDCVIDVPIGPPELEDMMICTVPGISAECCKRVQKGTGSTAAECDNQADSASARAFEHAVNTDPTKALADHCVNHPDRR